jgi:hypothetical protein
VRDALRGAPAIDAPFGFYERLVRRPPSRPRRPWWTAAAPAVAVAAVWIAVLGFAVDPGRPAVTPPVDQIRATLGTPDLTPAPGFSLHKVDPTASPLPDSVLHLPRHETFKTKAGDVLVVFGDSPKNWLAVLTEPGDADWARLRGGLRSPVAGVPGSPWQSTAPGAMPAIVYQDGDRVVTVTGTVPADQVVQAARDLHSGAQPSVVDRLRDACDSVLDAFSLR